MTVYILGGGPVGMALVDGLVDSSDVRFKLIDAAPVLGGLAQTRCWQGVGYHDLGPHKIFSQDIALVNRVEKLLPESDWLSRDKVSAIYMKGYYLPYPPSPFSLAKVFGLSAFLRMVLGYAIARFKNLISSNQPKTFEDDLIQRVGRDLYQFLFKPIALKLWGQPQDLDVKLSRGRVQTPKLMEVLARILKLSKSSEFEALNFRYPKQGLGRIWKAIESKAQDHGEFLLEHTVIGLTQNEGRISSFQCIYDEQIMTFELGPDDFLVSTLPLTLTTRLLSNSLPLGIVEATQRAVALNDLLLVFLHVDVPSLFDESWIFVPDPDIVFHRLSEQESFDPDMTPSGSIVCCEIMSSQDRPMNDHTDAQLVEGALNGLRLMGYLDFQVLGQCVIRLPKSYPVFKPGFEADLKEVLDELDGMENFRSLGRQGAFNYIGTLDAMDIGYGFVRWYLQRNEKPWANERARTNHYPVLD